MSRADEVIERLQARIVELEGALSWHEEQPSAGVVLPESLRRGDERGHDTKGSRKALGAMNARLKAKAGRLERELAELKTNHSVIGYREAFECWGRNEGVALWPSHSNPEIYYCGAAQKAAEAFKAGAEWHAITASAPNHCERVPSADDMADRFISWPLPDSVRPDPCAMNPDYPHRYGTNLMTWAQAKAMFDYVLAAAPSAKKESE